MPATIKDVAARSGVSPSTVSRVVADHPRISEETKRKVRQAMEELGYHPNVAARNLVRNRAETIGLFIPSSTEEFYMNPFFPEVLRGISEVARDEGYDLLLCTADSENEEVESLMNLIRSKRIDGVILLSSKRNDPLQKLVAKEKIPATLIGRPDQEHAICWVNNDNVDAGYKATRLLLQNGHRQIGFLGGSLEFLVTQDRLQGYKMALKEAGVPFDKRMVVSKSFVEQSGFVGMLRLLALPHRPTAIIASDDLLAFGAMRAASEMGYRIPDDLAIVGFNNIYMSNLANPSLTSVDVHIYELGRTAAELLFENIADPDSPPQSRIIPTELVIRNSCGTKRDAI